MVASLADSKLLAIEASVLRLRCSIANFSIIQQRANISAQVFTSKHFVVIINGRQKSDTTAGRLSAAAAAPGTFLAGAAAPGRSAIWSGGWLAVRRGVWRRGGWRRSGRGGGGTRSLCPPLRAAASPPTASRPAAARLQPCLPVSAIHPVPRAVLPLLPNSGAAEHSAAASDHHDTERVRGWRQVRGPGADTAAAGAARRAAVARAPRRHTAASSAVALRAV